MGVYKRGKDTWRISVDIGKVAGRYPRITETFHGSKKEAYIREGELKKQIEAGGILVNKKMTFEEFSENG